MTSDFHHASQITSQAHTTTPYMCLDGSRALGGNYICMYLLYSITLCRRHRVVQSNCNEVRANAMFRSLQKMALTIWKLSSRVMKPRSYADARPLDYDTSSMNRLRASMCCSIFTGYELCCVSCCVQVIKLQPRCG